MMKENSKNNETTQFCMGSVRVRFYLVDFDEYFWTQMPCRINAGDSFFIDEFISEEDEKRLKEETINYLYNEGSILECHSFIFCADKKGIYQQCYLT